MMDTMAFAIKQVEKILESKGFFTCKVAVKEPVVMTSQASTNLNTRTPTKLVSQTS